MKRWLGLFGVLVVAAIVALVWSTLTRERRQFDQVDVGMTVSEVTKIMGEPTHEIMGEPADEDRHFSDHATLTWVSTNGRMTYVVFVSKAGVVSGKTIVERPEKYDPCAPHAPDKGTSKLGQKCKATRDATKR